MQGTSFGQGYGFGITVMTETPEIERTGFSLRSRRNLFRSSVVAAAKISEFLSGLDNPNSLQTRILARASSYASLIPPPDISCRISLHAARRVPIPSPYLICT
jgi:hypothetical protein